jgi:UDP-N-acetyl-D-mannosaminuronic acid dehydrogenase
VAADLRRFSSIGVIGMGYVGLTLTAALAREGYKVHGVEIQPEILESLSRGQPHIFEPGVAEIFAELVDKRIFVASELPHDAVDAAVICVSTPVDPSTHAPYLDNLAIAARHVAERCSPETLVVVRSTVPVGTSREVVLPPLLAAWGAARLVMAPERTIQGQALRELVELPQVVGGLDDESLELGLALFGGLARQVVPVSNLETAEMVKLTNNCHTDVIYAFGNEVARQTEQLGLDPLEVIRAANLN